MPSPWRRPSKRKLATFAATSAEEPGEHSPSGEARKPLRQERRRPQAPKHRSRPKAIDKTVLALPEPRRVRDRDHVRSVARHPCLVCGRQPSDPHHLRFTQSRALGRKVSDEFTVPLCRGHHREVHRCDDEAAWWRKAGIDPTAVARTLWLETHPLPTGPDHLLADGASPQSPTRRLAVIVKLAANQNLSRAQSPARLSKSSSPPAGWAAFLRLPFAMSD